MIELLISFYLEGFPAGAAGKWENDVGTLSGDEWDIELQTVPLVSLSHLQ